MTTCRSLYVHVPFCRTLCGYCDFYSQVLDPARVTPLVDALLRELTGWVERGPLTLDTIYVGGGTPTVLPVTALTRLLAALQTHADPAAPLEFTVEANPATVSPAVADALAAAGVSRVSLGAQSFEPAELRVLDRAHRPGDVPATVAGCRRAGIAQISLDLIFGIPGQTLASWRRTLEAALAFEPTHLSCYGLTYEPGTPLHERRAAGLVRPVDEDLEADMYELMLDLLPAAGLPQYEISNFARPGCECRHNVRYWHNEPCLGIGPAAAGFTGEVRYKNVADTAAYVEAVAAGRSPWSEEERLTPDQRLRESAMLALRMTAGIDRRRFVDRFGTDPVEYFADVIVPHVAAGRLEVDERGIRLTRAGLLLGDRVMADFL